MYGSPLLPLAIWTPIIAGFAVLMTGSDRHAGLARVLALVGAVLGFLVTIPLYLNFDPTFRGFQFEHLKPWIEAFNVNYHLGIDGMSLLLILLNSFTTVLVVIAGWQVIQQRVAQYMAAFLFLSGFMNGVFAALDGLLFFIFFEATLIPMFVVIGIWGGPNRVYAAVKFFLYTFLGSVFALVAIIYLYNASGGSFSLLAWYQLPLSREAQILIFLAFFASFAVKVPMWPVHTWLPDAHVEAPTGGSVVLAAIMLKLGGYGFVRFSLPMFPDGSAQFIPLMFALSAVAAIYTSLVALVQTDMKKLIAYSSVAHMAFVTFGLFAMNRQGIEGAILVMLGHGLVSGALFLCVGVVYDRLHTREIAAYGGLSDNMPGYALLFMVFTMASIGLPGTSNFPGEFLSMVGTFHASTWSAIAACFSTILAAAYMLYLYWRICFGKARTPEAATMKDLSVREWWLLGPIIVGVFWMGIYPESFLRITRNDVGRLLVRMERVAPAGDSHLTLGKGAAQMDHGAHH